MPLDGAHGASYAGIHDALFDDQAQNHQRHHKIEIGALTGQLEAEETHGRDPADAVCAPGQRCRPVQGQEPDDFSKANGDYGEEVVYQLGARDGQEISHQSGYAGSQQHGQQYRQPRLAEDGTEISSDGIKSRLAQGNLSGVTEEDVKPGIDDDVDPQGTYNQVHIGLLRKQNRVQQLYPPPEPQWAEPGR